MTADDFAISVSLALTAIFLLYTRDLLTIWWDSYLAAARKVGFYKVWIPLRNRRCWTEDEWLCVGIFSGFFFNALDNIYWGISWAGTYYNHWLGPFLTEHGSWSNIVFRQLGGIWAVYCHVVAVRIRTNKLEKMSQHGYWASGLLILGLLWGTV